MSCLTLYRPDEPAPRFRRHAGFAEGAGDDEPAILPFRAAAHPAPNRLLELLIRARTIHRNKCCPHCGHPVVEPLVLSDAVRGTDNLPVPGTGTLAGFRCHGCRAEWPTQAVGVG